MIEKTLRTLILLILVLAGGAVVVVAEPLAAKGSGGNRGRGTDKVQSAVSAIKQINGKVSDARKKLAKVADVDLDRVLAGLASSQDTDGDGLPDSLELALQTSVCDIDSDDDGLSDGDEVGSGHSPGDDDFGDDDNGSSDETEVTALISAISSSAITLSSTTFAIVPTTRFYDRDKNPLTINDFTVGSCVEAEGFVVNAVLTAAKVKQKNSDDC